MGIKPLAAVILATAAAGGRAEVVLSPDLRLSGSIGVATDYIHRGLDLSGEALVPILSAELNHRSGVYLQGSLTPVDIAGLVYTAQEKTWQTQLNAGYRAPVGKNLAAGVAFSRYFYSDDTFTNETDYAEWSVYIDYRNHLTLTYHFADDLWGLGVEQHTGVLSGRRALLPRLIGEAALGTVARRGLGDHRYDFFRLNLGYVIRDWSAQVQFHSTLGEDLPYQAGRIGNQWLFQVNWHW